MASQPKKAKSSLTEFPEMDQETARQLFEHGAFLIFEDFPEGSEFGIDYNSWHVGSKFRGLKMIPPGIHFICYSSRGRTGGQAPRIGFFHNFKEKEILVKKWNRSTENIEHDSVTEEEAERYRSNLKGLDPSLGPYPYQSYKVWFSLSNHITARLLKDLLPRNGQISAQSDLVRMEEETLGAGSNVVDRAHPNRIRFVDEQGLPIMRVREGSEIRFHGIPPDRYPEGASASERTTRLSMDSSHQLATFIREAGFENEQEILGELQFAFICFLMGHVYESFEQWKKLVHLLCSCSEALRTRPELYIQFLMTLHFQLKECPQDFFVDIVSRNNFLTITLTNFFTNVETTEGVGETLKEKSKKFKVYLTRKFKWDFDSEEGRPTVSFDS